MLFIEFRFFVFFLIVLTVHWALRGNTARKVWLLVCSHVFYACFFLGDPPDASGAHTDAFPLWSFFWKVKNHQPLPVGWWFPFVLMGSTCMDYLVGVGIGDAKREGTRKAWLLVSLVINLGVLCIFKYYNFFIGSPPPLPPWLRRPHPRRGRETI